MNLFITILLAAVGLVVLGIGVGLLPEALGAHGWWPMLFPAVLAILVGCGCFFMAYKAYGADLSYRRTTTVYVQVPSCQN